MNKPNDIKGTSELSLDAAIENAREQTPMPDKVQVIETRSSLFDGETNHYQVTLSDSK